MIVGKKNRPDGTKLNAAYNKGSGFVCRGFNSAEKEEGNEIRENANGKVLSDYTRYKSKLLS